MSAAAAVVRPGTAVQGADNTCSSEGSSRAPISGFPSLRPEVEGSTSASAQTVTSQPRPSRDPSSLRFLSSVLVPKPCFLQSTYLALVTSARKFWSVAGAGRRLIRTRDIKASRASAASVGPPVLAVFHSVLTSSVCSIGWDVVEEEQPTLLNSRLPLRSPSTQLI
ncbi:hypothetical protein E2C01_010424 [Portunus trituberculatus]|uniref:Uncharacterized protein n=1 Tax=Portunus trituberculatus TaxID=210409 RepID=A0A5B7D8L1_PORTR|nr:hypothetical protein [Portunus trituberculatus]